MGHVRRLVGGGEVELGSLERFQNIKSKPELHTIILQAKPKPPSSFLQNRDPLNFL